MQATASSRKWSNVVERIRRDMYDYYREHIKPFIDFGKMKHKISTADRKVRCIEYDRIQARREYAIGQTA